MSVPVEAPHPGRIEPAGKEAAGGVYAGFRPRPFRAALWAPGPHTQTLAGKLFRPEPRIALSRERWETPDGDYVDLDFAAEPAADA
ncbi:MAG TPA: hypothetical protein VGB42_04655, partial [Candidatus Thermoplasmatota archaeon]